MVFKKIPQLKIVSISINELISADYNPRCWDQNDLEKLTESIRRFGPVDPLIVNSAPGRKNTIIGGHMRIEAMKKLGYKEAPVLYLNIPDIEKEQELCLRLNRNTGEWDFEKLKAFNLDMLLDVGFDLELSHIWDEHLETEDDDFNVEKELEKIKNPLVKPGDIWQLGESRLICGDATSPEIVKKLVGDEKVSMVYVDPPYNIKLDYNKGLSGKKAYGGTQTKDNKSDQEYADFLRKLIKNALAVVQKDCHIFFYSDQKYVGLLQQLYAEFGIDFKRVCIYVKNAANPTPQVAFNKVYEPVVYGVRGKPYLSPGLNNFNEIMNKEISQGNRLIEDMLDYLDIWLVKRLPTAQMSHPTEKSPQLHEKALRRCTKPYEVVLDLCAGSGSLMVACHQLKRRAYLAELEPVFCDLILSRYHQLTHEKAKKLN